MDPRRPFHQGFAFPTATTGQDEGESRAPSREEVETLCILHAVGPHGCPRADLATRLGLSSALAVAVAEGVEPLVARGWLALHDDRFSLTGPGHDWMQTRLSELGIM